ncbi:unnamed protein product [Spirodela intermedia]|uniref:Uncharacterized protein n=1 Tax=Spirodela intermedia TaxID=51605 RepID=A0A7I8LJ60_SPIIN|nr:unnamed protein product [Spirodela intermedia]
MAAAASCPQVVPFRGPRSGPPPRVAAARALGLGLPRKPNQGPPDWPRFLSLRAAGTSSARRFLFLAVPPRASAEEEGGDGSSDTAAAAAEEEKKTAAEENTEATEAAEATARKILEERRRREEEGGAGGGLWGGVAEEVREIEWPVFGRVLGTTGVVLAVIGGSSVALLTVNALLAELSDRLFAGRGVQDFFG